MRLSNGNSAIVYFEQIYVYNGIATAYKSPLHLNPLKVGFLLSEVTLSGLEKVFNDTIIASIANNTVTFIASATRDGYYFDIQFAIVGGKKLECPPGTQQNISGQLTCSPCPQGRLCSNPGTAQGKKCPAGYICDADSQVGEARYTK